MGALKLYKLLATAMAAVAVMAAVAQAQTDSTAATQTAGIAAQTWDCGVTSGSVTATLNRATLTISGKGPMGNWYYQNSEFIEGNNPPPWSHAISTVANVVIEDGVTSIGSYAFGGSSGLMSVTIPNSVTFIGNGAFSGCVSLTSVTIPNSVISIGESAFYLCAGLTSATIPNSVISIGASAFSGCGGLTSVTIPNSVVSIGEMAFSGCGGLTSVTIPNSVTSIENGAFYNCGGLISVSIPNSVTSIGKGAFYNCGDLASVTIPHSVTSIGYSAFSGCDGLASVTVLNPVPPKQELVSFDDKISANVCMYVPPNSVAAYHSANGWKSFRCVNDSIIAVVADDKAADSTAVTRAMWLAQADSIIAARSARIAVPVWDCGAEPGTVTATLIAGGVLWISGKGPMADWHEGNWYNDEDEIPPPWNNAKNSITHVVIQDGVTSIGSSAFYNCAALRSVRIPNSVTSIGQLAFSGCAGLTSVTIPSSVTSIGNWAFENCGGLTSVTIGDRAASIGDRAFENCKNLASVIALNPKPPTLERYEFNNTNACLYVPPNGIDAYRSAAGWNAFRCIKDTAAIGRADSAALAKMSGIAERVWDCGAAPETVMAALIGGTLRIIGKGPMANYDGARAAPWLDFRSSITRVVIEHGVTSIGNTAFMGCMTMTSATIPASVTSIGTHAFSGCRDLASVTIPNSVKSIGVLAFAGCTGLTSVTIGYGVTSIGYEAFASCTGLTSVIVLSSTPRGSFQSLDMAKACLYVPSKSIAAYRSAGGWKSFNCIKDATSR